MLSAVVGAMGSIAQGVAQSKAAKFNAEVADMNARISERRAKDALERGRAEEQKKRFEVAAIKGRQQAAMAANGVDLTFGSPLETMIDTAILGEMDALTIRTNAYRESYEHQVAAANKTAEGDLSRMNAKSALVGGYLGAASSILTGVTDSYGRYRQQSAYA